MSENNHDPSFHARDRKAWRQWLKNNHAEEKKVWLILYHKSSSTPSVSYEDAVEEALCFGWIDSRPNKRDAVSRYLYFSPRNPKSKWSRINRERVARLIKEKQMTPVGLEMVAQAKKSGTWTALDKVENLVMPPDFMKALQKNPQALKYFNDFPPSSKQIILFWIYEAKRDETRNKRIQETVTLAAKNIRANHYRQPGVKSIPK